MQNNLLVDPWFVAINGGVAVDPAGSPYMAAAAAPPPGASPPYPPPSGIEWIWVGDGGSNGWAMRPVVPAVPNVPLPVPVRPPGGGVIVPPYPNDFMPPVRLQEACVPPLWDGTAVSCAMDGVTCCFKNKNGDYWFVERRQGVCRIVPGPSNGNGPPPPSQVCPAGTWGQAAAQLGNAVALAAGVTAATELLSQAVADLDAAACQTAVPQAVAALQQSLADAQAQRADFEELLADAEQSILQPGLSDGCVTALLNLIQSLQTACNLEADLAAAIAVMQTQLMYVNCAELDDQTVVQGVANAARNIAAAVTQLQAVAAGVDAVAANAFLACCDVAPCPPGTTPVESVGPYGKLLYCQPLSQPDPPPN